MSYATESAKAGRKPITIVELILDRCAEVYGVAPCTAALSAGNECYNTRGTCQDTPNYNPAGFIYRFMQTNRNIPAGFFGIPCLESVSITPAKLTPGKGLGPLGSVSIKMNDFPHHDRGVDPYVATRTYTPEDQGTYWGKLLARNPHYQGRILKVYTGYAGSTWPTDYEQRWYIIERIDGPDAKGAVTIVGKDPLKLVDDDRARCPKMTVHPEFLSDGTTPNPLAGKPVTLLYAITETDVTNLYADWGGDTADSGAPFDLTGWVKVGEELIYYLLRSDGFPGSPDFGGIFGPLARGSLGTDASEHAVGDHVQAVKNWWGVRVVDVVLDLLQNYTDIDPSFISAANFDPDGWLSGVLVNAQIAEPTGVRTLLAELAEQCLFDLWWDEVAQVIRLKPLGPPVSALSIDDAGNIVAGTAVVKSDPNNRVSQVWLFYDQIDPTKGLTEDGNFNRVYIASDVNSESASEYGSSRVQQVRSRWFKRDDAAAMGLSTRLIARQKTPPITVKFEVDAKDTIKIGDDITVTTRLNQDATGASASMGFRVVSVHPVEGGHRLQVEAERLNYPGRYARITADSQVDYGTASAAEKAAGGFIGPTTGNFADGGTPYKVL